MTSPPADGAAGAPLSRNAAWAMLLVLLSGFALSQAYRTVTAIIAVALQTDFGLSPSALGLFASLFALTFGAVPSRPTLCPTRHFRPFRPFRPCIFRSSASANSRFQTIRTFQTPVFQHARSGRSAPTPTHITTKSRPPGSSPGLRR